MSSQRPLVLVVYPYLPHYRFGIFQRLAANRDVEFAFVADDFEQTRTIETIGFDQLPVSPVRNRFFGRCLWQSGLVTTLLRRRPAAVVFLGNASHVSTWVCAILLRLVRRPVIFWTIGWHRPESGIKRVVRLVFYRLANVLWLYGTEGLNLGRAHGYPPERMVRIGNSRTSSMASVPLTREDRCLLDRQFDDLAPHVVATVVRLNRSKRIDLLISAAARLQSRGKKLTLLIAGDGPEREALERQARNEAVDARFLGAVYSEEALNRIYGAADMTVLPSAAGLTVIQSLEHGTPVITHDEPHAQMPEAEAVVEGVTGGLYRKDDVDDLANKMTEWLGASSDPRIARACVAEVNARWSPESQADAIGDALRRLGLTSERQH